MKLLLLDIETAPNLVHVWGLWDQNVSINQVINSGYVLCWAAKWYGDDVVQFDSVHQSKPKRMLSRIHKMLNDCDAVCTYNGKSFDIPTLNKEFITHGFSPPSPYRHVDLCQVAKSTFRFPSNKLEWIARTLGLGGKTKHEGHELWIKCMAGDDDAWKRMEEYNCNDVALLEMVYERMRPWVRIHPNVGLYDKSDRPICPACGSEDLQKRGVAYTVSNRYNRYQCKSCGSWCRGNHAQLNKDDRDAVMRRVA